MNKQICEDCLWNGLQGEDIDGLPCKLCKDGSEYEEYNCESKRINNE